jgi:precorrin-3B synthase
MSGARRGACPSLSRPMQTGDGLLVRLQPANGALSPPQLLGLARAAGEYGNGLLEVTARGSLQLRGLTAATIGPLAEAVNELAIVPRSGVPVETNPLAGRDPEEVADAAPLAQALRAASAALPARLGPKVTVVVDGGGRFGLGALLADVRLEAVRRAEGVMWLVSLAGTAETATPVAYLQQDEAVASALRLLEAIAAKGVEARGRDLVSTPAATRADTAALAPPFIGSIALRNGAYALATALPFGQTDAASFSAFMRAAEREGAEEIRLASERRLLVLVPSLEARARLQRDAGKLGFVTSPDDARLRLVACAGAPACASGFLDAKRVAAELAAVLGGQGFHVSGCAKRCAEPTGRLQALVGASPTEAELVTPSGTRRVAIGGASAAIRRALALPGRQDDTAARSRRPTPVPAMP